LINKRKSAEEVSAADVLTRIKDLLQEQRDLMKDNCTALLWLQYLDMVDILRMFIKAERTGNWRLHLQALSEMLSSLAAAGHNLYAKSVRLYLQSMSSLETDHPSKLMGRRFRWIHSCYISVLLLLASLWMT